MQSFAATDSGESYKSGLHSAGNRKSFISATSQPEVSNLQQNSGTRKNRNNSNAIKIDPPNHVSTGQMVWYILRTNRMNVIRRGSQNIRPPSDIMLELFMEWLFEAALIPLISSGVDLHSQNSLNVDGGETNNHSGVMTGGTQLQPQPAPSQPLPSPGIMYSRSGTQDETPGFAMNNLGGDPITRRSFTTQSTASSNDIAPATPGDGPVSNPTAVFDYPAVDGIVAGRAAALGSLCKIVCAKSTDERLSDEQLAHFYLVIHEALIERDRIVLCSLLYYSVDLFKLNLRGVEILLPNYLAAIDIILTESVRLRLHPSVHPVEMRNACLRALSAIVGWPTVFGRGKVFICEMTSDPYNSRGRLLKTASLNKIEETLTYLDLRQRILRILVHVLRNESNANNLHLALGLCHVFCASNALYDTARVDFASQTKTESDDENDDKCFAVSALRGVVSAICDNLCKPQWNNDLITCLAALDCLNSLATLPHSVLFHKNELSTGSLILTSLCRFVDTQLQKPPMLHSRDLHSSIVLAYFTLANWISSAPMLMEIESCFSTLAHIIEFGMTGRKGLGRSEYKPASQRVCDAADYLLNTLFNLTSPTKRQHLKPDDELALLQRFGSDNIDLNKFHYFLLNDTSLIAFHEAQHIHHISKGLPTVFAVIRTPYREVHSTYFQLCPKATLDIDASAADKEENAADSTRSPGTFSAATNNATNCSQTDQRTKLSVPGDGVTVADTSLTGIEPIKQFAFPQDIHEIKCKLDAESRPLEFTPDIVSIQNKLAEVRLKLEQGSTGSDSRDKQNIWIQPAMNSFLSQIVRPEDSVKKCNSLRVFLYDMGLISRRTFGRDLIPIDSASNDHLFMKRLHTVVDRTPIQLQENVSIFYVKRGQRKAEEILQNCEILENTSPAFCALLSRLGRGVDVGGSSHWADSLRPAFTKKLSTSTNTSPYVLDGSKHILYQSTGQVEMTFVTPTLSSTNVSTNCRPCTQSIKPLVNDNADLSTTTQSRDSDVSYGDALTWLTGGGGLPPLGAPKSMAWQQTAAGSGAATRGAFTDKSSKRSLDMRIFVVWTERAEEIYNFPLDDLLVYMDDGSATTSATSARRSSSLNSPPAGACRPAFDYMIIYLCEIGGLVHVQTEGVWARKYGQPTPLVDGMVVPAAALPVLLQQTVCSVARRKIVEVENYQFNHVKRRLSILEFSRQFTSNVSYTEFFQRYVKNENSNCSA